MSAPILDGVMDWPLADKIISFQRDGVLLKLQRMAPHCESWITRITKIAYGRGFDAGVNHGFGAKQNPYSDRGHPNFMKGGNNPYAAWIEGCLDGDRVRRMLDKPENILDMQNREYKLLPLSMQNRMRTHTGTMKPEGAR